MKRLLLAVLIFCAGMGAGIAGQRQSAMWAVTLANAKTDAYSLAAVEIANECRPKRGWFKK